MLVKDMISLLWIATNGFLFYMGPLVFFLFISCDALRDARQERVLEINLRVDTQDLVEARIVEKRLETAGDVIF